MKIPIHKLHIAQAVKRQIFYEILVYRQLVLLAFNFLLEHGITAYLPVSKYLFTCKLQIILYFSSIQIYEVQRVKKRRRRRGEKKKAWNILHYLPGEAAVFSVLVWLNSCSKNKQSEFIDINCVNHEKNWSRWAPSDKMTLRACLVVLVETFTF